MAETVLWVCLGLFVAIKLIFGSEFDLIWSLFYLGQVIVSWKNLRINKSEMVSLNAALDMNLRTLDLLMNFKLSEYTFIRELLKNHYCPVQAFMLQVPTMLCAIIAAGVLALMLGGCILITKTCPKMQSAMVDAYESFVWSGIIKVILQSFLVLCFSMATDFNVLIEGNEASKTS